MISHIMSDFKAIRIRLYPTLEQEILFRRTAGCCRFVYNLALEQRSVFSRSGRSISFLKQQAELKFLKAEAPWLKEAPHHCLMTALRDLEDAFTRFFTGQNDFPQPRRKGENDSFRFPDPSQIKLDASKLGHQGRGFNLFLPKAGWIKAVLHRPIPDGASLKSITVSRDGAWWMASMLFAIPAAEAPVRRPGAVGIDLGVAQPVVLSDGTVYTMPRVTPRLQERERRLMRTIARRKKGSRNRRKAVMALARFKAKIARRRKDRLHKITTAVAKNHGTVVIEDLRVSNMTKSAKGTMESPGVNVRQKAGLNRSMLDVAPGLFRTLLDYKVAREGGELIAIDPRNTSRTCPQCGHVAAGNRPSRDQFRCERCGHEADADVNAAVNILAKGLALPKPTEGIPVSVCGGLGSSRPKKQKSIGRKPERMAA